MTRDTLPDTDSGLADFTANIVKVVEPEAVAYGTTILFMEQYKVLQADFAAKLALAREESTRGTLTVAQKRNAAVALRESTRQLIRQIRACETVTTDMLDAIGVKPVDTVRTRRKPPTFAPQIEVKQVNGVTATLRLRDTETGKLRMNAAAAAAYIFTFVGEQAPTNPAMWFMHGTTTRSTVNVQFNADLPPGTKVWFVAFYVSPTQEAGPNSVIVSTYLSTAVGGFLKAA